MKRLLLGSPTLMAIALFICAVLAGCCSTSRHGDAELKDCKTLEGTRDMDRSFVLMLPAVSLARERVYRFRVTSLPVSLGNWLMSGTMSKAEVHAEDDPSAAWGKTTLTLTLMTPDGTSLYRETFALGSMRKGYFGESHEWYTTLHELDAAVADLRNFVVEVEMKNPSTRKSDSVSITGFGRTLRSRPHTLTND